MRSDTISFAPGIDGAGAAGCSGGLVVAALNACSACERESPVTRRAMSPPVTYLAHQFTTAPHLLMIGAHFAGSAAMKAAFCFGPRPSVGSTPASSRRLNTF